MIVVELSENRIDGTTTLREAGTGVRPGAGRASVFSGISATTATRAASATLKSTAACRGIEKCGSRHRASRPNQSPYARHYRPPRESRIRRVPLIVASTRALGCVGLATLIAHQARQDK